MTKSTLINLVGLLLIAGCFIASVVKLTLRTVREERSDQIVIRFCHWQLESGLREAFDKVGAAYAKMHPDVRIEQTAVPGVVYGTYVRTRLTGANPPDLVEYGAGMSDESMAKNFTSLGEYVNQPNPYNRGTELENVPWRETFIDGLGRAHGLDTLQDYYAIPFAMTTARMYYNKAMYRQITGTDTPPETFEQFMDVCAKTADFASSQKRMIVPVAGSKFNANILLDELMRSQTQKLAREVDVTSDLRSPSNPALVFLSGGASLDTPDIRKGLSLMREVALQMQPGFLQFDRDEAMFYFAQQRALMIATGSWDYQSIALQSPFEIGIFKIPLPSQSHPVYGPQVIGRRAEVGLGGGGLFVSQSGQHKEQAIDFLRFLTSQPGHQIYVDTGKWLPAIRGVKPAQETLAFAPSTEGVPDGFNIAPLMWGSGEVFRIQSNSLHLLMSPNGSVDAFVASLKPQFDQAVRTDIRTLQKGYLDNTRRLDVLVVAGGYVAKAEPEWAQKRSAAMETQAAQEADYYWLQYQLQKK